MLGDARLMAADGRRPAVGRRPAPGVAVPRWRAEVEVPGCGGDELGASTAVGDGR